MTPPSAASAGAMAQKQPHHQSGREKQASGASNFKNGAESGPGTPSSSSSSKRRKVGTACIYCRRSHMTCDEGRPCKRCIKRDIGHLCHDESTNRGSGTGTASSSSTPIKSSVSSHPLQARDARRENGTAPVNVSHPVPMASTSRLAAGTGASGPAPAPGVYAASPPFVSPYRADVGGPYSSASPFSGLSAIGAPRGDSSGSYASSPMAPNSGDLSLSLGPNMSSSSAAAASNGAPFWGLGTGSVLGGAGFLGLGGGNGEGMGASGDVAGGNEYNILSEFLESLDGSAFPTPPPPQMGLSSSGPSSATPALTSSAFKDTALSRAPSNGYKGGPLPINDTSTPTLQSSGLQGSHSSGTEDRADPSRSDHFRSRGASISDATPGAYGPSLKGFNTKTEKFFLTAADQNDGTRDERLGKVIQAKYDAGLLRPYNHVNGYARLNRWMEENASQASRRRILKPLSVFRPAFRAVAQSLTNVDLIYIEEAFERLLLDYDRVFSTQGIPACLWRRTGEIYKGNKEFAELVGVGIEALREGRCTIYELMEEESAVNYWEKYGAVSFDPGQKAVLTSCVLKTKAKASLGTKPATSLAAAANNNSSSSSSSNSVEGSGLNSGVASVNASGTVTPKQSKAEGDIGAPLKQEKLKETDVHHIPCCFSFTIRRDAWSIPCLIVGNFLPLKQ